MQKHTLILFGIGLAMVGELFIAPILQLVPNQAGVAITNVTAVHAAEQPTGQPQGQTERQELNLTRMELQAQYAGPLDGTIIQRLRDPVDGTVCYIYMPISVEHSPVTASGFIQYGANTIGSISCMAPTVAPPNQ